MVKGDEVVVIVPTRRAADGSHVLALPKGHVDPGETPVQAAQREVREETGVLAEPVRELGTTRYWYGAAAGRSAGSRVLPLRARGGDIADHDDEVEDVRSITLDSAEHELRTVLR